MLINNLIYECDERYSQNKDGCQCEYCKREICNESNCAECLRKIHYPEKDSEKRTYDCVNMLITIIVDIVIGTLQKLCMD